MKVLPFTLPGAHDKTVIVKDENIPYFYPYLHNHEQIQLTYIKEGEGTLLLGNMMHSFKSNEVYLIGANCPHVFKSDPSYFLPEEEKRVRAYTVFFSINGKLASLFSLPELKNVHSFYANDFTGFRIPQASVSEVAEKIICVNKTNGIDQLVNFFQLLKLVTNMEDLVRLSGDAQLSRSADYDGKRINTVYRYIKQNFHRDITLEEVAAVAYMTPQAFCRYFKKHTRLTFVSYLNDFRINEACKMLLEREDSSVSSIAYECGFKSITNFNRVFKAYTGKSPKEYLNDFISKAG
jgi:AraC-like DNA-binding protein